MSANSALDLGFLRAEPDSRGLPRTNHEVGLVPPAGVVSDYA